MKSLAPEEPHAYELGDKREAETSRQTGHYFHRLKRLPQVPFEELLKVEQILGLAGDNV